MGILTILDTETGQVMLSIILGLGLAALFQRVCTEEKCTIYQSPDDNKIINRIFTQNGTCYEYIKTPIQCTTA
jgi:hypothetical protein